MLNVWTEIEPGNLAVESEKIEWAVGGKSPTNTAVIHTRSITVYLLEEERFSLTSVDSCERDQQAHLYQYLPDKSTKLSSYCPKLLTK